MGIIHAFKAHYRSILARKVSILAENSNFNANDLTKKVRVIEAIYMMEEAWNRVTPETIQNCFKKAWKNEQPTALPELLADVEVPSGVDRETFFNSINPEADFEANMDANLNLFLEDSDEEEEPEEEPEPKSSVTSAEVFSMLQTVRTHLQTEPGVKSEWLNGLESVLMKKIENERKTQPRITQFFHQRQSVNDNDIK